MLKTATPAPPTQETMRQLRARVTELADRVAAIQTNGGHILDKSWYDRFIGMEQTILAVLGGKSHIQEWLGVCETAIRKLHKTLRADCGCAVCRRLPDGPTG